MDLERIRDPRVVPFLLKLLGDSQEGEDVRIHVLKQLRGGSGVLVPSDRPAVAKALANVLTNTSAHELRLQAAVALGDFTEIDGVLLNLVDVSLAQEESIDLRYAAFTSIERAGATPACVIVLQLIARDEALGDAARSVLLAWHVASPNSEGGRTSMTIRILLVNDHRVVRSGLRAVLEAESDFEVVGEAGSGTDAVRLAHRLRPDVVLTDLLLADLDGVAVTDRIRAQLPDTQVVILTGVSGQEQWVVHAIRAGAISFLMKSADVAELVQAIRQAAQGQVHLSSRAAALLVREVRSPRQVPLTVRERDVLREIAFGRTNKEIARSLDIGLTTVKSHVGAILDKLGVDSRTQAALHAMRSQILSVDELQVA